MTKLTTFYRLLPYSFCLSLLLCCLSCNTLAQSGYVTAKTAKKKSAAAFQEANLAYQIGRYTETAEGLERLLKKEPAFIDAWVLLGETQIKLENFGEAEKAYERAIQLNPKHWPTVLRRVAAAETRQDKYGEAIAHLEQYLATNPKASKAAMARKQLRDLDFIQKAKANPVPFEPQRLSDAVNTEDPEYSPCISADGNTLIFSRDVRSGQVPQEDFFVSYRTADGSWSPAKPLTNINTPGDEGSQGLSADGRTLVFTVCNRRGGYGSCDLWIAESRNGKWQAAKPLPAGINTASWESQPALSADGNTLYFASNRPGSQGKDDIFFAQRNLDGHWGPVQALDTIINTPGSESSPYLHADGQTLYFRSDYHPGMGDADLFLSRRQPDGSWGTPENLGYPINTANHEGALIVTLDGRTGYFASDRADLGTEGLGTDIYQFELPPGKRATPATYVRGRAYDAVQTGSPGLAAVLTFLDVATGDTLTRVKAHEDGAYLVCLPVGKNYSLTATYPGYLFFSAHFELSNTIDTDSPFEVDAPLQPVPAPTVSAPTSQPIILRNVFFATGSAELLATSTLELDRLYESMNENPGMRIQINGHTDNVGQPADNQQLSEARANAVMNYLIEKGITDDRLKARGFGESQPIADNNTPEGRQQNRRTAFVVW